MLHFEGVETFPVAPADVYARLADAGWLANALPDAAVTAADPDKSAWKVRPKFGFMAGTLDTTAEVRDRASGERVAYRVTSSSVGARSTVDAVLTFAPADGGTTVRWTGDLTELGGLLKMVPRGLLQAAAQTVIADVWLAIRAKIAQ